MNVPNHIAVIMDGNGRWAKARFMPRTYGHKVGFDRFRELVKNCYDRGVKYLTVYAFSTENLSREKEEVSNLFSMALKAMEQYLKTLNEKGIKVIILGDTQLANEEMVKKTAEFQKNLSKNEKMTLCVAFCYGGRQEILNAVNKALKDGKTEISSEDFSSYLYTSGIPDPDLIIRTSGEKRISNFLLWQSAYSEYYFTDVLWPDFDEKELDRAIEDFSSRKRRYGK